MKFITTALLFFFLLIEAFGQRQPLSRQDSALVLKFDQAYEQNLRNGDKRRATDMLNQKAIIYWNHNQYQEAVNEYDKSLALNKELGNENGIAMISNNLGMLNADLQNYQKSLGYFYTTLAARRSQKEKVGMISALINMSVVYNNLSKFDSSIVNLDEALRLARELNDVEQMRSCYGMLSETYEKKGDTEKSYKYFELYRTFHEKLLEDKEVVYSQTAEEAKLRAQLAEAEKKNKEYELQKKQLEVVEKDAALKLKVEENQGLYDSLDDKEVRLRLVEKDAEVQKAHAEEQKAKAKNAQNIRNYSIAAIFLVLIITLLIYRNSRQRKRANDALTSKNIEIEAQSNQLIVAYNEIEKKNKNITRSINYASRIQSAMLNRNDDLSEIVKNSFILFKPRDVVSGDFYWYEKIDNKIIIAAIDCTGHGVPGAFMSMLGANLMDQIVINEMESDPSKILMKLHEGVTQSLHQTHSENRDGMDAAICSIDTETNILTFAGAKNPLVYIKDNEVVRVKGDTSGIGGSFNSKKGIEFTNKTVEISSEMSFYIFSDGFADQFGGTGNKKYNPKKLREKLLEIHQLNFNEQETFLSKEFTDWKGECEQTDDVLIIGFRIS